MTRTIVLTVPDISCGHCAATVKRTLTPIAGVQAVEVDLATKHVTVEYDPARAEIDHLTAALAAEDYPVAAVGQ